MNNERTVWPVGVVFLVACFLFAVIIAAVKDSTPVPAIDADRAMFSVFRCCGSQTRAPSAFHTTVSF